MKLSSNEIKTISILLRGTAKYVYKRILNTEAKLAYKNAMNSCLAHIESGWESISILQSKIDGVEEDVDTLHPKGLFWKNTDNRMYHRLACSHARDAINSIVVKFVTGGEDPAPRILKNKGVHVYEDEGIF
jgi:hypothetical protein